MKIPPPPIRNPQLLRRALAAWFRRAGRDLPWRRTRDAYAILVSEVMCQQTRVATVVPYYERWLARFPSFAELAAAEEGEVLSMWQGLGYYSRARNLHAAAKAVVERHGGRLPADRIAELPGVGRYTAGAVAAFAYDLPVAAVDGNIARVLARLCDVREPIDSGAGSARIWAEAEALLPARGGRMHTSALMELGALVCTPRAPRCGECPVRGHCTAREPESLPVKRARARIIAMDEPCGWMMRGGEIVLVQQAGPRWRGMWKLPRLAATPGGEAMFSAEYPFTNHRVALRVYDVAAPRRLAAGEAWFSREALRELAITAPHRRAIEAVFSALASGVARS